MWRGTRSTEITTGNDDLKLTAGNLTMKLDAGKSSTEAMQGIELKCGQNSIKIDPTGITISGMMIKVEAQVQLSAKGTMVQISGDAMLQAKGGITMIG